MVTRTDENDLSSYIIPSIGVRINLADVSDSLPVWTLMNSVNNRGDILGSGGPQFFNAEHVFLLERVGH